MQTVAVLQAMMTAILAAFGAYIAWRQWKTAHNRLKFDHFEKRLAVYDATIKLLDAVITHGFADSFSLMEFLAATRNSRWLFNKEVADYLREQMYKRASVLLTIRSDLHNAPQHERDSMMAKQEENLRWLISQHDAVDAKFAHFLQLDTGGEPPSWVRKTLYRMNR